MFSFQMNASACSVDRSVSGSVSQRRVRPAAFRRDDIAIADAMPTATAEVRYDDARPAVRHNRSHDHHPPNGPVSYRLRQPRPGAIHSATAGRRESGDAGRAGVLTVVGVRGGIDDETGSVASPRSARCRQVVGATALRRTLPAGGGGEEGPGTGFGTRESTVVARADVVAGQAEVLRVPSHATGTGEPTHRDQGATAPATRPHATVEGGVVWGK